MFELHLGLAVAAAGLCAAVGHFAIRDAGAAEPHARSSIAILTFMAAVGLPMVLVFALRHNLPLVSAGVAAFAICGDARALAAQDLAGACGPGLDRARIAAVSPLRRE